MPLVCAKCQCCLEGTSPLPSMTVCHLLQPAPRLQWFLVSPRLTQILPILCSRSLQVPPHLPGPCEPSAPTHFPELRSFPLPKPDTSTLHTEPQTTALRCITLSKPINRKMAPRRQGSRGFLAGHLGLSSVQLGHEDQVSQLWLLPVTRLSPSPLPITLV